MEEAPRESPRLKALELQGYKTFAGRVEFRFGRTITAIVGPNGSGKSNIADAIRWVLGEQSYGLLRGKKTEDMIFAGSESRPRASMASATITFDNDDGWLPIEFSEVTVSRRAYRDAQNEYFLNNQRVRLRDVFELLSETGLAQRTYTIIGQGLVDAVLALKAEERRRLFEEAAGIGLYRARREEALRRLEATQHNLERVQDILTELLPRVRSLERQARRAREYEQVREDLKAALRTWYGYHWLRLQKQVSEAHEEAGRQRQRRDDLRAEQEGVDRALLDVRGRIESLRAELHAQSQRISARYAERETLGRRVAVSQERLRGLAEQDSQAVAETAALEAERQELTARLTAAREEMAGRQQTLFAAEEEWHRLGGPAELQDLDQEALQSRMLDARARRSSLAERQSAWRSDLAQVEARLQSLAGQAAETGLSREAAQAAVSAARKRGAQANEALQQAQRGLQGCQVQERAARDQVVQLEQRLSEATEDLRALDSQVAAFEARLSVLREESRQQQQALARLEQAVREGELSDCMGRLSGHLNPEEPVRMAILAALGEAAHGLVFREPQGVEEALALLAREARQGRVSLLPQSMSGGPPALLSTTGVDCLGNAAELARPEESVRPVVLHLLGSTLVVERRDQAPALLTTLPLGARVVTLAGEVFAHSGEVLAGIVPDERPAEGLAKVEAEMEQAESARRDQAARLEDTRRDLDSARRTMEEATRATEAAVARERDARLKVEQAALDLQAKEAQLESLSGAVLRLTQEVERAQQERRLVEGRGGTIEAEEQQLQAEMEALELRLAGQEGAALLLQLESRVQLARAAMAEAAARTADGEARLAGLQADLENRRLRAETRAAAASAAQRELAEAQAEMQGIEASLSETQAAAAQLEEELSRLETERSEHEAAEARGRSDLQEAERAYSQAQIDLARREQELDSMRQRIEDDFGLVEFEYQEAVTGPEPLPLNGWVERLPRVEEIGPELEGQVTRLRLQLRRMGVVNVEASREYEEVRQRADFLTTQLEDLRKAEAQIREVIAELDLLMEREFRKTFDAVAVTFRQVFTRLFGGGSARLVLTDSEDLTNTGIDIEARLPGRREHGLAMLSGGERSLTACALVFSLLKVSPTPFCVLDEVDAMLDEANVGRFCEMLRELSVHTQFIIITHNRQTIQTAEVIYGVTMGADSASRVLSLQLDEAEKVAAR